MLTKGIRRIAAALMMTGLMSGTGWAQESGVWVQIEARPTLDQAREAAAAYAAQIPDVVGHDLGSGWFGIQLGPYTSEQAAGVLRQLRSARVIPPDSFIVDGRQFRNQYWPDGETTIVAPPVVEETTETAETTTPTVNEVVVIPDPVIPPEPMITPADETPAEAQASEAELSLDEKKELQIALQWAGFYQSTIDGLFGRGTRNSMSLWQEANNFEVTGILTTTQRTELLRQYNAVLEGMDMALVRDDAAGIEIEMPTGVVEFAAYAAPFSRYEASGEVQAQVILISQPGNQDRFFGLYEILQTLEVIPTEGPRERRSSSFEIEGSNARVHTYVSATLENDEIKGFVLVWPAGDEERRTRVLDIMQDSFTRIEGVLDPAIASAGEEQSLDLVSGLAIRQPLRARSGFFIDGAGTVLTILEAVESCGEVVIDSDHPATVLHRDADLGLAVLQPQTAIAPLAVAAFQTGTPRLQSEVAVAGYPYGGLLSAPSLVFGTLADVRGLNGEPEIKRLSVVSQDGDSGGPVFDNGGAVIGMLMPTAAEGRVLPADVAFSLHSPAITASLDAAGIGYQATDSIAAMTPEMLTRAAADVTVLVACWE